MLIFFKAGSGVAGSPMVLKVLGYHLEHTRGSIIDFDAMLRQPLGVVALSIVAVRVIP